MHHKYHTTIRKIGGSTYALIPKILLRELCIRDLTATTINIDGDFLKIRMPKLDKGDLENMVNILKTSKQKWTVSDLSNRMFGKVNKDLRIRTLEGIKALCLIDIHVIYDMDVGLVYWVNYNRRVK